MHPPDASPCWAGAWSSVGGLVDLWAHSAVLRTVGALPTLHPWRLGDVKGVAPHAALVRQSRRTATPTASRC